MVLDTAKRAGKLIKAEPGEPAVVRVAQRLPGERALPRARKFDALKNYRKGDRLLELAVVGTVLNYDPPDSDASKTKSSKVYLRLDDGTVLTISAARRDTTVHLMNFAMVTRRIELQKLQCLGTGKQWLFTPESVGRFHRMKNIFKPPAFESQGKLKRIKHLAFFTKASLQLLTGFVRFEPQIAAASTARTRTQSLTDCSTMGIAAARDGDNHRCTITIRWHDMLAGFTAGSAVDIVIGSITVKEKAVTIQTLPEYVHKAEKEFAPKLEPGFDWHLLKTGRE